MYIFIGGLIIAIVTGVVMFGKLPDRVEAAEKEIKETQVQVKDLAQAVEVYVAVNAQQQIAQEKREALMLTLIAQMTKND